MMNGTVCISVSLVSGWMLHKIAEREQLGSPGFAFPDRAIYGRMVYNKGRSNTSFVCAVLQGHRRMRGPPYS